MVENLNQDYEQTTIKGIPWKELKLKLKDPTFDA